MIGFNDNTHRSQYFLCGLFLLFLFSIYTEIPLAITGSFYIPAFITILLVPILFIVNRKYIFKSDLDFLLRVVAVFLLSIFLSPTTSYLPHKLFSAFPQVTLAIVAGILFQKIILRLEGSRVEKVLFRICLVLLVGVFLENIGLLRGVSDTFREFVYTSGGYRVYDGDERDISLAGFIRPKLFTSEPSLLAIGFFAVSSSWLILTPMKKSWMVFILGTLIMYLMLPSPILIGSLLLSFIIIFLSKVASRRAFVNNIIIFSLILLLVVLYFSFNGGGSIGSRLSHALSSSDSYAITSSNMRITFPFITLVDVLGASPLFGLGIGGKDAVVNYSSLPFNDASIIIGNNAFVMMFLYLGIVGGGLFLWALYKYVNKYLYIPQIILLMIIVFVLMQFMGGFVTPRFWGYVLLFIAIIRKRAEILQRSFGQVNKPMLLHKGAAYE